MLARRRMLRLHHERHPNLQPSRITDNSEPWFTEWPPSLATLLQTNCEIWKLEAYLNNRASTGSAPL